MNELPFQVPQPSRSAAHPTDKASRSELPWITYTIIGVCGVIFAYLNLATELPSYRQVEAILLPSRFEIWSGAFWAFLTSAFVHLAWYHILFNMLLARDLGTLLEPTMGRGNYVLFILAAAIVSSGVQLAISSQTCIGFSGVVYAMFGYALAARNVEPHYRQVVTKWNTIWLLGWLVLCIILTRAGAWNIANGAHAAGFLFGYCAGNAFAARVYLLPNLTALALLVALTVSSAIYMPWSGDWRTRGIRAARTTMESEAALRRLEVQYLRAMVLLQNPRTRAEALSWFLKSAKQGYVPAMNGLAWFLATDREDRLRNGPEAVKWAQWACQRDNYQSASYIDTLAAAFAECEKWDQAVSTQKLAISKLANEDAETKASVRSHLQDFIKHRKVRE